MCLTGTLLRTALLLLVLAKTYGKHKCNYEEILGSYREVIFVELQNLNLTDLSNSSKESDLCPSGKAHRILLSIYDMAHKTRCQRTGKQQSDLRKPMESMEQLITHNCRPDYLGKKASCSTGQRRRGKKRKKMRLIKVIKALITCWQKLQSVYVLAN